MRVLILGGAGMLGHKLWQVYQDRFDTWVTVRSSYHDYTSYNLFDPQRTLGGIDAFDFDTVMRAFAQVRPQVVINCIGIIKQLSTAKDPIISLTVNALFPHRLANLCQAVGARLVHISTDCVFSGRKGMYTENDISDAEDLYGRTKFLGEVGGSGSLTLRTSIIGRELCTTSGLVEWFLTNRGGHVRGYTKAIYSGFTTLALARIIAEVLEQQPALSGVYQVSSEPINKYDLLCQLRDTFNLQIEIEPYAEVQIDRSLDSRCFRAITGFVPPAWPEMIREMAADPAPYEQWRNLHS
jgi:dTDP-4-dehydrorhamnose reductase